MRATAAASVPGKTILFGEHAVVYGHPAIVTALDHRMTVTVRMDDRGGGSLTIGAERIEQDEIARVVARGVVTRPADLAIAAVALAVGDLSADVAVEIDSAIPAGAGFGSSAALAVGIADACRRVCGRPASVDELAGLALAIERFQHGNPSGSDVRAVLTGGTLRFRRTSTGIEQEELRPSAATLSAIRLFESGARAESTGEMIAAVSRLSEREAAFHEMTAATESGHVALENGDAAALMAAMRRAEAALEAIGVVHPDVRSAIRRIESSGGAAKVSGAGGVAGKGSGLVLVLHPDAGALVPAHWREHRVGLGAPGLREEVAA